MTTLLRWSIALVLLASPASAGTVTLRDSQVTGNATCGSSLDAQAQVPWGVCAND